MRSLFLASQPPKAATAEPVAGSSGTLIPGANILARQ